MADEGPLGHRLLDRFGFVFGAVVLNVLILLIFEITAVPGAASFGEVVVTVLTGVTLVFALLAAGISRPFLNLALVAAVFSLGWTVFAVFTDFASVGFLRWFWFLLVIATPFVVLRRLVSHRTVTVDTLLGAASVYLLIAVAFMFLLLGLDSNDPGSVFGSAQPTTSFMYFSLVTITTLGYGDLSPKTDAARALAVMLAVLGQIYLVFVVSRMVGLYTRTITGDPEGPS
jgi:Ion channel